MDYDKLFKNLSIRELFKARDAWVILEGLGFSVEPMLTNVKIELELRAQREELEFLERELSAVRRTKTMFDDIFKSLNKDTK